VKSELRILFAEPEFISSPGLLVTPLKDTLVVRFFCAEQVVDNPREFVSAGRNGLGFAELPSIAPKELTDVAFAVMQGVRRQAESGGNVAPEIVSR
jgi:hypothetical protein